MAHSDSDTREKILTSALELFSQRGFEGASIRDIAEKAGINKSLVHYHFRSKSDVLVELARGFLDEALSQMGDFQSLSDFSQPGALEQFLTQRLDYLLDHRSFLNILIIEALKSDPQHHFIFDLIQSLMDSILGKNQAAGIENADFQTFFTRFFFFTLTPMLIFSVMEQKLATHFHLQAEGMKQDFKDTMIQMFLARMQGDISRGKA